MLIRHPITDIKLLPGDWTVYSGRMGDIVMTVRQPQPKDLDAVYKAESQLSQRTIRRYGRTNPNVRPPNPPPTICDWGMFKPGDIGWLHVIMEVEGIGIVGFGKHYYDVASNFHRDFKLPNPDDIASECTLCVIDKYQRRGFGTLYGSINELICKTNGSKWLIGKTYTKGGMHSIRTRSGFATTWISPDGTQVRVRGKL